MHRGEMFEKKLGKGFLGFHRVALKEGIEESLDIIEAAAFLFLNKLS
jgi:hypothetical protein